MQLEDEAELCKLSSPFDFGKITNLKSGELSKLQAFERANFGCFQEIKASLRKQKSRSQFMRE